MTAAFKDGKPVIRCSSLDQLLSCPGSRTLAARLGERVDDDDASSWEGQWCHYQAALRFVEKHGAMAPVGGLPEPRIPQGWRPPEFADWIVDFYHRSVMEETPGDWAMEVESELLYEFDQFWLSGHCDVNAVAPDASALQFDDLKSGSVAVDPAECNWQVLGYAALFKRAYPMLRTIRGRIIQPRLREEEGRRISAVNIGAEGIADGEGRTVSPATIETFTAALAAKINDALAHPMRLRTGAKQCRWCPAALQCPALIEERTIMELELTPAALAAIEKEPNPDTLARWGAAKKLLEPKLKKAWELLKKHAEQAGGYTSADGITVELKDWTGARTFTDKIKAWEQIVADLDAARAYGCMDLSVPALEKAYAAQFGLPLSSKAKDCGEAQVANRLGALITQATGKQLTLSA